MCQCTSCTFTDSFAEKPFADWPRGEPKGQRASDAEYAAHWRHCGAEFGRKLAALSRSPFPCHGTVQTDPRIGYHFPGGQIAKVRNAHYQYRGPAGRKALPSEDNPQRYAAAFCKANHLAGAAP